MSALRQEPPAQPPCHRGSREGADARDAAGHRPGAGGPRPAAGRRRHDLERILALQHAAARPGPHVKTGVREAGGTPFEFTSVSVTDGIANGPPRHEGLAGVARDWWPSSIELVVRGHCYDAIVGLAGCDKTLPGRDDGDGAHERAGGVPVWRLAAARPGRRPRRRRGRGVRRRGLLHRAARSSARRPAATGARRLPDDRRLPGAVHREHHGGGRRPWASPCPARRFVPAVTPSARHRRGLRSHRHGPARQRASGRATSSPARRSENAATVVAASGGSTNAALHLPAIANEAGVEVRPGRRRRSLPPHTLSRRHEAGGTLHGDRPLPDRRRAGADQGPARRRPPAWRLPDRHRPDPGREPRRRACRPKPGHPAPRERSLLADGRRGRPEGFARAGRRDLQGGPPEAARADWSGAASSNRRKTASPPCCGATTALAKSW